MADISASALKKPYRWICRIHYIFDNEADNKI